MLIIKCSFDPAEHLSMKLSPRSRYVEHVSDLERGDNYPREGKSKLFLPWVTGLLVAGSILGGYKYYNRKAPGLAKPKIVQPTAAAVPVSPPQQNKIDPVPPAKVTEVPPKKVETAPPLKQSVSQPPESQKELLLLEEILASKILNPKNPTIIPLSNFLKNDKEFYKKLISSFSNLRKDTYSKISIVLNLVEKDISPEKQKWLNSLKDNIQTEKVNYSFRYTRDLRLVISLEPLKNGTTEISSFPSDIKLEHYSMEQFKKLTNKSAEISNTLYLSPLPPIFKSISVYFDFLEKKGEVFKGDEKIQSSGKIFTFRPNPSKPQSFFIDINSYGA